MNKTLAKIIAGIVPDRQLRKIIRQYLAGEITHGYSTPHDEMPYIAWKPESSPGRIPALSKFERNTFSEFGEDGILEHIFLKIGAKTKYAVEFGAWDGKHCSNAFNLVLNHGWRALMIEGNPRKMPALQNTAQEADGRIEAVFGCVGIDKYPRLDAYLENCPEEPDVLSMDVDGLEYHIWESLKTIRPRVVVVEFNPSIPADIFFIQAKNENIFDGSSAAALADLGTEKGYSLAAVTKCNLIFVDNAEFPKLEIGDNSLETLWSGGPKTRIFHSPSGKIYTWGMPQLLWERRAGEGCARISPDTLQYYSSFIWGDGNEMVEAGNHASGVRR